MWIYNSLKNILKYLFIFLERDIAVSSSKLTRARQNGILRACHKLNILFEIKHDECLSGNIPGNIPPFRFQSRWSGDVIRRTGMKNFNAVSHNHARPYFRIQHGRGEVRARRVYLNVHSVTGNVVDREWSVEFWRWKCCREFGNNT